MIPVDWVLRKVIGLDDAEMKLMELKPGDRVKVMSYDSDPSGKGSVKVAHEVAEVVRVGTGVAARRTITVKFITGKQQGKHVTVIPSTVTKIESAIDALGATGDAGEVDVVAWDDMSD